MKRVHLSDGSISHVTVKRPRTSERRTQFHVSVMEKKSISSWSPFFWVSFVCQFYGVSFVGQF